MKKKKTPKQAKVEMMLPRSIKWFDDNNRFKRSVTIKPYSTRELAGIYGISPRIMRRWLGALAEQLGPCITRSFSPMQVEIIFRELGVPGWIVREG